jgi:hypothetical protein
MHAVPQLRFRNWVLFPITYVLCIKMSMCAVCRRLLHYRAAAEHRPRLHANVPLAVAYFLCDPNFSLCCNLSMRFAKSISSALPLIIPCNNFRVPRPLGVLSQGCLLRGSFAIMRRKAIFSFSYLENSYGGYRLSFI